MKQKRCYQQGVVKKTINGDLEKGQIVEIIMQDEKFYFVKKNLSCIEAKVEKKYIIVN